MQNIPLSPFQFFVLLWVFLVFILYWNKINNVVLVAGIEQSGFSYT